VSGRVIPLEQRLADKTRCEGDCIIWTGYIDRYGYGSTGFGHRKPIGVHRAVWMHNHGPIPKGLFVCHTCDRPACVNIRHLFLGTPKDNTQDMIKKGRKEFLSGENHPMAKLSSAQVDEIRLLRSGGKSLSDIAEIYSITFQNVSHICLGKGWK